MDYMLVRHKVKDYNKWKMVYDQQLSARIAAGLKEVFQFRNADSTNETIVLFEAADLNLARKFTQSADLRKVMEEAGVIDQPTIYFMNSVQPWETQTQHKKSEQYTGTRR